MLAVCLKALGNDVSAIVGAEVPQVLYSSTQGPYRPFLTPPLLSSIQFPDGGNAMVGNSPLFVLEVQRPILPPGHQRRPVPWGG